MAFLRVANLPIELKIFGGGRMRMLDLCLFILTSVVGEDQRYLCGSRRIGSTRLDSTITARRAKAGPGPRM
jgi:hypothetical protein